MEPGSSSASASFTEGFILTVTGGSGDGYAEPLFALSAGGSSEGFQGFGEASASLGGCALQTNGAPPGTCSPMSVPFVFGVPQMLTLSESTSADVLSPWSEPSSLAYGNASMTGFEFFDANGQPLNGVSYSFVSTGQPSGVPEPGTFPILTTMACAALIAFARRRRIR